MKSDPVLINRLMHSRFGVIWFLIAYGLIWIIVPLLSNAGLPTDTAEILSWSREWPMGVYWTVKSVFSQPLAFSCVVISPLVFYLGSHLPQWNANIAQFPFVGLMYYFGWKALNSEKLYWWFLVGVVAAAGIQSKYSFILLMAALFLGTISCAELRRRISISGVALSAVTFGLLITPHLIWLNTNFDRVFSYINASLASQKLFLGHVTGPLLVFLLHLSMIILPFFVVRNGLAGKHSNQTDEAINNGKHCCG